MLVMSQIVPFGWSSTGCEHVGVFLEPREHGVERRGLPHHRLAVDDGRHRSALAVGAVAVRALQRLRGVVVGHRRVGEEDLAAVRRVLVEVVDRLVLARRLVQPVDRQRDRDDRGEQERPALHALEPAALELLVGEVLREVRRQALRRLALGRQHRPNEVADDRDDREQVEPDENVANGHDTLHAASIAEMLATMSADHTQSGPSCCCPVVLVPIGGPSSMSPVLMVMSPRRR